MKKLNELRSEIDKCGRCGTCRSSCPTFMLSLGLDGPRDLAHHTVLFARDYARNVREVTGSARFLVLAASGQWPNLASRF